MLGKFHRCLKLKLKIRGKNMAMLWTEEQLKFIKKYIHLATYEIHDLFNKKFKNNQRTYNSIQKKVQKVGFLNSLLGDDDEEEASPRESLTPEQYKILNKFTKIFVKKNRIPTLENLEKVDVFVEDIQLHFGNMQKLHNMVFANFPEVFKQTSVSALLKPENRKNLKEAVGSTRKFIITTAIAGAFVNRSFLKSLEGYAKINKAELLIMIAADPAHQWAKGDSLGSIDEILGEKNIIVDELKLNDNLTLSSIKLSAKQIDPVTGMDSLAQLGGNFIFASPKQRLKFVAVVPPKHPLAMMGTGAITDPSYSTDWYMSRRTGYIADKHHVLGAVIVELADSDIFHFRQIQADENGSFIDLGIKYDSAQNTTLTTPIALVCGDEHAGHQAPEVLKARKRLLGILKPTHLVLHDLFDGTSISHHVESKTITKALRSSSNKACLAEELRAVALTLKNYESLVKLIVIVKSNHDEHLVRYLEDGRFVEDPNNYRISLDLAGALFDGKDPVKFGVEKVANRTFDNIKWLIRDERLLLAGVDVSNHGDKGPNGSKGGIKAFANCMFKSVTGHTHTAEIFNGAWRVGTSTGLLAYCSGPSSWTKTDCIINEDGSRQLINYIYGEFSI